jgi:hypothetical protein
MKKHTHLAILCLVFIIAACNRTATEPDFPNTILGRWHWVETQAPGTGPPGVWSAANPAGRYMELQAGGVITGTAFTDVTSYQLVDSVTLKLIAPTQPAGFRLFNYRLDSVDRALYFYIRPANGGYCIEGCGTL